MLKDGYPRALVGLAIGGLLGYGVYLAVEFLWPLAVMLRTKWRDSGELMYNVHSRQVFPKSTLEMPVEGITVCNMEEWRPIVFTRMQRVMIVFKSKTGSFKRDLDQPISEAK